MKRLLANDIPEAAMRRNTAADRWPLLAGLSVAVIRTGLQSVSAPFVRRRRPVANKRIDLGYLAPNIRYRMDEAMDVTASSKGAK